MNENIYNKEWENTIKLLGERRIGIITTTSWKEYPERTTIEPQIEATAADTNPWFPHTTKRRIYTQSAIV